jgi:hypothetical protein
MLARSTKLHHPLGVTIETPLLVPSFSSKGFGSSNERESEVRNIFNVVSEYLTDSMLISAYDLAYGNLDPVKSAITEITIVDSGGYEISDIHDPSAIFRQPVNPRDWRLENLQEVYDEWAPHIPAVFVSFDRPDERKPLKEQIDEAKKLFARYPQQLNTLLVKPETKTQHSVQIKNVIANVEELNSFDIVGITEDELGNSILKRMQNISLMRLAMDDAGVSVPLHVYGSLDPLTTVLYFLAGAEVFDGLTWLRFGYANGFACYRANYGVKSIGIDRLDDFVKAKTMRDNLSYLVELNHQMHKFLLNGDFARFGINEETVREAFDLLCTKNPRLK